MRTTTVREHHYDEIQRLPEHQRASLQAAAVLESIMSGRLQARGAWEEREVAPGSHGA
jgi:hypothetical protein